MGGMGEGLGSGVGWGCGKAQGGVQRSVQAVKAARSLTHHSPQQCLAQH